MERLERMLQCDIIQAIEDGFNGHDIKRDEILKDVNWLIEQAEKAEKQHFEILALESNLKGNDKIIAQQQMEIDSLTLDKGYLLEENKALKEHRDNLNSIIFDLEKEIAKWKEKEFAACSKHHEFIDEIEQIDNLIEENTKMDAEDILVEIKN